jgi:predicted CoA-substrate-specific enzyme activase
MQCVTAEIHNKKVLVENSFRCAHEGNPRKAFIEYIKEIDKNTVDRIAVTGRTFRKHIDLTNISEPEALEHALKSAFSDERFPDMVISSGGETQLVYTINSNGGINAVHSGNKCASGTGEFFLQQIRRMDLSLNQAVEMASSGVAHKIAGRCSVFCKSDCTHALNKGELRENIAAGLCLMMADKISDLVKDLQSDFVIIVGGGSKNHAMVEILRKRFPRIEIPEHADCFEALGAAIWASEHHCKSLPENIDDLIIGTHNSFSVHRPLSDALHLVDFRENKRGQIKSGDDCILGLDVGSTTTKAVLMRRSDTTTLASIYLRTNGDPVRASIECYKSIKSQIGETDITISGLGVTGSGRQIAGLHALTENIINEIIAHATAATYFDKDVDTIFEIGGQDAKYTYLTGGVPSDYAMNEACSAGTGSFLEESAKESLNIATELIGELALKGKNPPNFTDQCSAFISSDIKIAAQEGTERDDILAGLVYSIGLNYLNRVKGSRPVGKKIFMQGGVCYNKAVPVAIASLMNTQIIVPPDPGLMGAYGVALEVNNRIALGMVAPVLFSLEELINRAAVKESSFVCLGGKDKCDRKCEISRIRIADKIYPFGGICNRYYNLRLNREVVTEDFDLVAVRQNLLFEKYGIKPDDTPIEADKPARTVGIIKSFLTHSFYPLYSNFFNKLGFRVVLSDSIDPEGISRIEAAFCLPAEISHGSFASLLKKKPDYLFVPQVAQIEVPNVPTYSKTCVFVQGEPYYLKTTFRKELEQSAAVVLSPVLRMDKGYEAEEQKMIEMARKMGVGDKNSRDAYRFACKQQRAFEKELLEHGARALEFLDNHKDTFGVVLFGRPYNAFTGDANMGIPHKVASRGFMIIPHDMLPVANYEVHPKMFWGMGQKLMKAAQFVKERKNLFGFYITNFSCGPDSFLLGYFRRFMQEKPSLTLELDQHTADAGIDTRIEAAVDIITRYRRLCEPVKAVSDFLQATVFTVGKEIRVRSSDGNEYPLIHKNVEVVIPSMGRYGAEGAAAVFRGRGVNAKALPIADKEVLLEGRKSTTCKECLPYILTTGSYLKYLSDRTDSNIITVFFMATGGGPCRLGQYCTTLEHLIEKNQIKNAAILPMTDENGYGGMGTKTLLKGWQAINISDVFSDMRSMLAVAAKNKAHAMEEIESSWKEIIAFFEGRLSVRLSSLLSSIANRLSRIPLKKTPESVPVISLIGEIFVRKDEFSRKNIVDYLENHGFMVRVAPIAEYMCYSNYVVNSGLGERTFNFQDQVKMKLTAQVQEWWERRIKSILADSKLYKFEMIEVDKTIRGVSHLINENFRGEAILTVGLGLREILHDSCGIISIGPFGCMPSRVAESMLKREMNVEGKKRMPGWEKKAQNYADIDTFPFLSIETDGSPFPQLVEANMEAFILQAKRVHEHLLSLKKHKLNKKTTSYPVRWYDIVLGNGKILSSERSKTPK